MLINVYNHSRLRFANGRNSAADDYRINLYTVFNFNPTHTEQFFAELPPTVQLPTGFGYVRNAVGAIRNLRVVQLGTDGATFTCDDIVWIASSGPFTANHAAIFNFTDAREPLLHMDFEGTVTFPQGVLYGIKINANGLVSFKPG